MEAPGEGEPPEARAIRDILESMGVTDYEPRVVGALLDFAARYAADVLAGAEAVAERAAGGGAEVGAADVMLAAAEAGRRGFHAPPLSRDLAALAAARNGVPLPEPRPRHGLRLPPDGDCLLAPNWQVAPAVAAAAAAAPQQAVDADGPALPGAFPPGL